MSSQLSKAILSDLRSAATTDAGTVDHLRRLLGEEPEHDHTKVSLASNNDDQKKGTTRRRAQEPKLSKSKAGVPASETRPLEIYARSGQTVKALSTAPRRKLATEAFNVALKCLTSAVKARQETAAGDEICNAAPQNKPKANPLQPCSPNKQVRPRDPTCTQSTILPDVSRVADCAMLAMRCLEEMDGEESCSNTDTEKLQKGVVVLIERLISLRLAERALDVISRIYHQYWKRRQTSLTPMVSECGLSPRTRSSQLQAYALLDASDLSKPSFDLAINYQSQVLRLAILSGPQCVTETFVGNMKLTVKGSPAQVVLNGLEKGLLDKEKAGQHLRTVSQALLKLYSVVQSSKQISTGQPGQNLALLTEALTIKCESWALLGHSPDIRREFWMPFSKGLKRFRSDYKNWSHDYLSFALKQAQLATSTLHRHGLSDSSSFEVAEIILDMAEDLQNYEQVLNLLREYNAISGYWTNEQQALIVWRSAIMQYKCTGIKDSDLLHVLAKVSRGLSKLDGSNIQQPDKSLSLGARLRKVMVAIIHDLGRDGSGANCPDFKRTLFEQCLQVFSGLLDLWRGFLTSTTSFNDAETWRLTLINFAKTLEATLEAYRRCAELSPGKNFDQEVDGIVRASKEVLKTARRFIPRDELITAIERLLGQASHMYWLQYLAPTGTSTTSQNPLQCLNTSCDILKDLSPSVRHSASYPMILDKLAISYLTKKDVKGACESFQSIVNHYIECGALHEAARIAPLNQIQNIWLSKGTKAYSLGQALSSLARLRLTYGIQCVNNGSWIFDRNSMSVIERSVLFGQQVHAAENHVFTQQQAGACEDHFNALLELYNEHPLDIDCLRFISNFTRFLSRNPSLSDAIPLTIERFAQVFDKTQSTRDSELPSNIEMLHSLLRLQLSMQSVPVDVKRLKECIQSLSAITLRLPNTSSLQSAIENIDLTQGQLRAALDVGKMLDDTDTMLACLLALKHILTLTESRCVPKLADVMIQLAELSHRMGKTVQASNLFIEGQKLLGECSDDSTVHIRWALSYMDHLIDMAQVDQAIDLYDQYVSRGCEASAEHVSGRQRLEKEMLLSRAAQVASRVAFQSGNLGLASRYAKQALRLSTEIWQLIECSKAQVSPSCTSSNDDSVHSLTAEMSNLNLSTESLSNQQRNKGSRYWNCVSLHCSALQGMIDLAMHYGLYQDAIYYAQQLRKLAESVGSHDRLCRVLAALAVVHSKAGHELEAAGFLKGCGQLLILPMPHENRQAKVLQAEALIELKNYAEATSILDSIEDVSALDQSSLEQKQPVKTGIQKAPLRGRAKSSRPIKEPAKRPKQQITATQPVALTPTLPRLAQSLHYLREKSLALRRRIDLEQETVVLTTSQLCTGDKPATSSVDLSVTTAMAMLQQALADLSSDAVRCVLAETVVALPVRYKSGRRSGRVSFVQTADTPIVSRPIKGGRSRGIVTVSSTSQKSLSSAESLLIDARKLLFSLVSHKVPQCSSDVLHVAHKIQHQLMLLSSAMTIALKTSSSELILQLLAPKDLIRTRECLTVSAERAMKTKTQVLAWPETASLRNAESRESQFDYSIDGLSSLPSTWSVISISLAENQQELLVSKIVSDRSPFLLRIPLSRSDLEVEQDEDFSFADAKADLVDIIDEANLSAHDSRGQGDRDTRKEWYAEREELDRRLESWLHNVENIWLGGFRGLMCSRRWNEDQLARFGQQLQQVLDKHLPSRQKSSVKANRVTLHVHVIELFMGLGHPDEQELDDAATDLLYFVVDILQFSGEHNAYDEIDFDAMLVDVFDALRHCHETQEEEVAHETHTVLIVDKELASFPWESLPCLRGQSVSRMPSLGSVFDRLRKIRDQSSSAEGYSIPADRGAYILNPSSDLASTQTTFQPVFESQLEGFTSETGRAPSEAEFTSLLTTNSLLLYFGHGSGAQYIRGRTVRSLESCAVTLLMGCSSAKMTECGKFESYGTPGYYIGGLSGCMAVVGTLWDVTDRDIDRFAMKTMLEWGLIKEDDHVRTTLERSRKRTAGKGTNKAIGLTSSKGVVGLDEAVSRGRDACLLKYLNGAAPVVYGVPVFLSG